MDEDNRPTDNRPSNEPRERRSRPLFNRRRRGGPIRDTLRGAGAVHSLYKAGSRSSTEAEEAEQRALTNAAAGSGLTLPADNTARAAGEGVAKPGQGVYDRPGNEAPIQRANNTAKGAGDGVATPQRLAAALGGAKGESDESEEAGEANDNVGKGYTGAENKTPLKQAFSFMSKNRKKFVAGGLISSLVGGAFGMFTGLETFQLHHILANLDAPSMARLQGVDTRDRSRRYLQAYMSARLMDIAESKDSKKSSDNLLFRAEKASKGGVLSDPLFWDWYNKLRTVGGTSRADRVSQFEQDLFERRGIKFTSVAYFDNNQLKTRPAIIQVKDTELSFDPTSGPDALPSGTLESALKGDVKALESIDRLTGKLNEFVDVNKLGNDKEARKAIKAAVNAESPKWFNYFMRRAVRKDIQNMIGVRGWRFFDLIPLKDKNGNPTTPQEMIVGMRNRLIIKALPANSKSGLFIKCIFGIESCSASTDPSNPDNRSHSVDGKKEDESKKGDTDGNGSNESYGDGNGAGNVSESVTAELPADNGIVLGDTASKIASHLAQKLNVYQTIFGILDSLSNVDESLSNGSLSKLVYIAKLSMVMGMYITLKNADDQVVTGQFAGDQFNGLMQNLTAASNNEWWSTTINHAPNQVDAATWVDAKNKEEYCGPDHQEVIKNNPVRAEKEFAFLCPEQMVGGPNLAKTIEDGWNNTIGKIVHPILQVYKNSIGLLSGVFSNLVDFITGPIMKGLMSAALGIIGTNIEDVTAWITGKVASFFGASTPPAYISGQIIGASGSGAVATAETATRGEGGALTNEKTKLSSTQRYYAYMNEKRADMSIHERYFALNNPDSALAKLAFSVVNNPPKKISNNIFGSIGSMFSAPFNAISRTANADWIEDPYAPANLAGVYTYDFPVECLDADPIKLTPETATNADDLGIFTKQELNWDLMTDRNRWYDALYEKVGDDDDKAQKVWNCALIDNSVRGGIGGAYGYKEVGNLDD